MVVIKAYNVDVLTNFTEKAARKMERLPMASVEVNDLVVIL